MSKEMKALTINGETYEIVDEYARSHSGSGSSAELEDIRLGADGKTFETAGEAVRQQFRYVGGQIDHIEEEIQNIDSVFEDICYDSDGYKYPTPGDTIRMQFDSVKYSMENIDESINHVMDVFDIIQEEVYDARIGADGVEYPTAGEAMRVQFEQLTKQTEFRGVVYENMYPNHGLSVKKGFNLDDPNSYKGVYFYDVIEYMNDDLQSVYYGSVKKGDSFVRSESFQLTSGLPYLIVTGENSKIIDVVYFDDIEESYIFSEDGSIYLSFQCTYDEDKDSTYFYIKSTGANEPLVLWANNANEYLEDSMYGDEALKAILSGRQILVRVPNASGDNYVASYSPIYMYQLPNYENNYLYLFYLKDEKQNIDLSALGLGTIQVPLYGELKLLLSENYYKTPL